MLSHNMLYFGEVRRGTVCEKKVWISPRFAPDFQIHKVCTENPEHGSYFDFVWEPVVYDGFYPGPRRAYCLRVALRKAIPFGRVEGNLQIFTDIPGQEKIVVPVLAVVIGEIGVSRDYVPMGLLPVGVRVTKRFMVYHREGKPLQIYTAQSTVPFLELSIQTIIPDQYHEISVSAKPDETFPPGEFRGAIVLTTSSQEQPGLTIPVQGFIQIPEKKR
jgi:hypothetical protein